MVDGNVIHMAILCDLFWDGENVTVSMAVNPSFPLVMCDQVSTQRRPPSVGSLSWVMLATNDSTW